MSGLFSIREILDKVDELFEKNLVDEAGEFLRLKLAEVRSSGDHYAELTILSELMGYYRKTGDIAAGLSAVYDGLELIERLGMDGTVSVATILINAATTLKAFGKSYEAIGYYKRARRIYEAHLAPSDNRLSGLYNNMALCLVDLGQLHDAEVMYNDALEILFSSHASGNLCNIANTYMNMAYLYESMRDDDKVEGCLKRCELALKSNRTEINGYYAFTLKKCCPGFAHFGWFAAEKSFNDKADSIYKNGCA